jgi:type I restriction enzyme M protein
MMKKLTIADKKMILDYIRTKDPKGTIVSIKPEADFSRGEIKYSPQIIQHVHQNIISKYEEWIRAYIITRLVCDLNYPLEAIEIEKEYNIGRPKPKYARIDIIVRDNRDKNSKKTYFFIECKAPLIKRI